MNQLNTNNSLSTPDNDPRTYKDFCKIPFKKTWKKIGVFWRMFFLYTGLPLPPLAQAPPSPRPWPILISVILLHPVLFVSFLDLEEILPFTPLRNGN